MDAQGAVAGDRDLRMRVGRRQAHARAVAGEVGDGRETVGAERTETVRTGPAAGLLHALPEQLLAGESGGGVIVGDELQGLVAGDDLGNAVEVDVGDGGERSLAVVAQGAAVVGLRAERLAGGAV